MARLEYQPVAGPQVGNAAFAVNDAARNVTAGLTALGTGLTNLGERQEKRVEMNNAKRDQQIKNAIAMYAEMAPDEASLQGLMAEATNFMAQPGQAQSAPKGFMDKLLGGASTQSAPAGGNVDYASIFSGRRTNMLIDESTRAGIRSTDAVTAGQNIDNAQDQLLLDDQNLEVAWNREFGADLNRAAMLASDGKIDEARAIEQDVVDRAGDRFGARPDAFFKRSYEMLTAGDDARSGVTKNALDIDLTEEQIATSQQARRIAASQEADRDRVAEIDWKLKTREFDNILKDDTTKSRIGTIVENAYGLDHAIELIELQTDLTPAQRNTMKQAITRQAKEDPKFFETMNPSKTQFSYPEGVLNPNRVAADVVATIQSRKRDENSSVSIFEKANAYDSQGPDVAINIKERFEERKIDEGDQAWLLRLRDGEFGNRKLTDGELVAMVDEGLGASGIFRNEVGFNRSKMKKLAKEYGNTDPAVLSAEADRFDRDANAAMRMEARVSAIESEIVRARDAKDVAKLNSLTAELDTITADLTGLMLSYRPDYNKKVEPKPGKAKSGKDMTAEDFKPNGPGNLATGRPENGFPVSDSDIIPRRGF